MIRYSLVCDKGHDFESWFRNSAAYDRQAKRGITGIGGKIGSLFATHPPIEERIAALQASA